MIYPQSIWRLLINPPGTGAWNMAVDEAILQSIGAGISLPTLRLYAWEPACLSLGYAQLSSDVDHTRLNERGWELVRRPTGGKAILHTDELTYSVIVSNDEPRLLGSVLQSYQRISQALLHALQSLSLPARSNENSSSIGDSTLAGPVCFEVPSHFEITVGGKKLVGSAQARKREGVLQHGSLPLHGDLTRITQVLTYENDDERTIAAGRLLERATTIEAFLGYPISWGVVSQAFITAFTTKLNLDLQPQDLSPQENSLATRLVEEKYSHPDWTNRI